MDLDILSRYFDYFDGFSSVLFHIKFFFCMDTSTGENNNPFGIPNVLLLFRIYIQIMSVRIFAMWKFDPLSLASNVNFLIKITVQTQ